MDSFYQSDYARKSEIQGILTQEFNNDKTIAFVGSNETLNPADVYKMLGLAPTYSLEVVPCVNPQLSTDNATYTYSNTTDNLVGFSVEKLDVGAIVVNYFYSYDMNAQTKVDVLGLIANTSSANITQRSEVHEISTQGTVVGNGYADWTTIPVIYSTNGKWMAQLVLYLARTGFVNNNTSSVKSTWQFTSVINMTFLSGGDQIYELGVYNDCNYSNQGITSYSPDTTISNSSQGFTVSAGVNDLGVLNIGLGASFSVTMPDVQVVPHYDAVDKYCSWGYGYKAGTLVAKYGNQSVQQITFTNTMGMAYAHSGFYANFGTWFAGVFGIGAKWTKQDEMPLTVVYKIGVSDIV
jgi:hypothetical protein